MEEKYNDIDSVQGIKEDIRRLRKKFLTYKEAELVYSMQHKKLMNLADRAGAIYRMEGTVLINRDIFDVFLENFHQAPMTNNKAKHPKNRYVRKKEKAESEEA
ncbi:MAG: DUF6462 family protein [Candidatus Weimeria sp.]